MHLEHLLILVSRESPHSHCLAQ